MVIMAGEACRLHNIWLSALCMTYVDLWPAHLAHFLANPRLSLVQQLCYGCCLTGVIPRLLIALCDSSHMFMMIPPAADLTGLLPFASLLLHANKAQAASVLRTICA